MITRSFLLVNDGLHARPAALFVQLCNTMQSKITLTYNGREADAKSILGIMTLGVGKGCSVQVSVDGADEQAALDRIADYLNGLPGR